MKNTTSDSNYIGIQFELNDECISSCLNFILDNIHLENFFWYNDRSQEEIFTNDQQNVFFEKQIYNGKEFSNQIEKYHYIIFAKLQAYFLNGKISDLNTYQDFLESDCQVLILIYDSKFVDIYVKDENILNQLKSNAENYGFENVKLVTKESDLRTGLNIR